MQICHICGGIWEASVQASHAVFSQVPNISFYRERARNPSSPYAWVLKLCKLQAAQGSPALTAPPGMVGISQIFQESPDAKAVLQEVFGDRIRGNFIKDISGIFSVCS